MKLENKDKVAQTLLAMGLVVLPLAAFYDYELGHYVAMVAKLITTLLFAVGLYLCVVQRIANVPRSLAVVLLVMATVGILTKQGDPSSLIWSPVLTVIFYFLTDLRLGTILSVTYFVLLALGYYLHPYLHGDARMPFTIWMQGGLAYLVTATVAVLYERMRLGHADALRRMADHDFLTGILNRRGFVDQAERERRRAEREGQQLALLLFDIDDFKKINDQFGHDRGDELLQQFTGRIGKVIRAGDLFGRWGGEEFILILSPSSEAAATEVAEALRRTIADTPFPVVGRVTSSIGMTMDDGRGDIDALINRADEALYTAKTSGKNLVVDDFAMEAEAG